MKSLAEGIKTSNIPADVARHSASLLLLSSSSELIGLVAPCKGGIQAAPQACVPHPCSPVGRMLCKRDRAGWKERLWGRGSGNASVGAEKSDLNRQSASPLDHTRSLPGF